MTEQAQNPSLKEINALKKKLNWGDVPAIYRMATTAIGDLDGILSHGFDSAYKNILDRTTWNLDLLQGYKDAEGNLQVKIKRLNLLYFCSKAMLGNSTHNVNDSTSLKNFFTINDLREKDYNNMDMSPNERLAIKNFDRFRIQELNKQSTERDFHRRYLQLQVMANLSPYEEFLKEEYYL